MTQRRTNKIPVHDFFLLIRPLDWPIRTAYYERLRGTTTIIAKDYAFIRTHMDKEWNNNSTAWQTCVPASNWSLSRMVNVHSRNTDNCWTVLEED